MYAILQGYPLIATRRVWMMLPATKTLAISLMNIARIFATFCVINSVYDKSILQRDGNTLGREVSICRSHK